MPAKVSSGNSSPASWACGRARIAKRLSQEALAHAAGISTYTYQKFEKDESRPGTPMNPRLRTLIATFCTIHSEPIIQHYWQASRNSLPRQLRSCLWFARFTSVAVISDGALAPRHQLVTCDLEPRKGSRGMIGLCP